MENFLMTMTILFGFIGFTISELLEGELSFYCLAMSALFLARFEALKDDWVLAGAEILASIFFIMLSLKIRKYRKLQRD
jgi:putative effector of murein hydrolase LrgA (UPF0299 family)